MVAQATAERAGQGLNTLAFAPRGSDWRVVGSGNRPISPAVLQSSCTIKRGCGTIVPLIEQMRHSDATNGANDSASCR